MDYPSLRILVALCHAIICASVCSGQEVSVVSMEMEEIVEKKAWKGPLFVMTYSDEGKIKFPGALVVEIDDPLNGNPGFVIGGAKLEKRGKEGLGAVKRILSEIEEGSIVVFQKYCFWAASGLPLGGASPSVPFDYKELSNLAAAKRLVIIFNNGRIWRPPVLGVKEREPLEESVYPTGPTSH